MGSRTMISSSSPLDALWYTNLQLLGYPDTTLSPTIFDLPNIAAFQQVFHYLLCQVDADKVRQEMRDCWPVLDKKQEVEFRRKVVGILKEWQKDNPTDIPHINPSLFQSPGGRKFKTFVHMVSTWVLRTVLDQKENLLSRPGGGRNAMASRTTSTALYERLVKRQEHSVEQAATDQGEIVSLETKAKHDIDIFASNYIKQKNELEIVKEELKVAEKGMLSEFPNYINDDKIDKERLLSDLEKECASVREMEIIARKLGSNHTKHWDVLNKILDQTNSRPTLDLSNVAMMNLELTYRNLISFAFTTTDKVLQSYPANHISVTGQSGKEINQQMVTLESVANQLEATLGELKISVDEKLKRSLLVDWATCILAPRVPDDDQKDDLVLLPPTPSMLPELAKAEKDQIVTDKLSLISPFQVQVTSVATTTTPCTTPVSIRTDQMLQRRFPRKLTPDQSPLLRQSLLQSTIRNSEEQNHTLESLGEHSETKESVFSPVLSSTLAPPSVSPKVSVDNDFKTPRVGVYDTASKIDHYKRVLRSVQSNQTPHRPARAGMIEVWESHRKSISPRPVKLSLDLDVVSRLDQLMDSLTLSDDGGNLSMDSPLLSPHCPF